tara:strand:- start:154 stop:519 length:366 start_codon:yes stop_codon:yes gene_type:complete
LAGIEVVATDLAYRSVLLRTGGVDALGHTTDLERDVRAVAERFMDFDIGSLENQCSITEVGSDVQILLDVGLSVGHEVRSDVPIDIDEERFSPTPHQRRPVVYVAIEVHTPVEPCSAEHFN